MDTERSSSEDLDPSDDDTTILLVDDEPAVVESFAAMLETEYRVRTATSGSAALDLIDQTVDIVFLDRRMPDMSGDEVLAELRQQGYEMPIVMLSAIDPKDDIADMPIDEYLTKPVSRDDLFNKVGACVDAS